MAESTRQEEIVALFRETREAHHDAYRETDGADPDWPIWYADFLQPRLGQLLKAQFTRSELVYVLISLDRALQRQAPGADWATFYARTLVSRYL